MDGPLGALAALGRALFGAAACSIALLDPDEEHLVFRAAGGTGADEVIGLRLPVNRGIAGWVVSSGQPIAVQDVRQDPRFARDVAESTGYVPTSILAMPIESERALLGVVEVLDRAVVVGRDDMELLGLLAGQAAVVVESLRPSGPVAADPELAAAVAELGPAEQRAAVAMLRALIGYAEGRGGPAGVG